MEQKPEIDNTPFWKRQDFRCLSAGLCCLVLVLGVIGCNAATQPSQEGIQPESISISDTPEPSASQESSPQTPSSEEQVTITDIETGKEDSGDEEEQAGDEASPSKPLAPEEILNANLMGGPFSLREAPAPDISQESSIALVEAIKAIEDHGLTCGFVLIDVDTGQGISYNPQWAGYTASTAKALFASYLLDSVYIDGLVPDADVVPLQMALTYSDNDSYDTLVYRYYTQGFIDWLWKFGIYHELSDENGAYPYASASNLAAAWILIASQLDDGTPGAELVSEALSQTEVSFIRDGIGEGGWFVRNKGGWIDEYGNGLNATNDTALIERDGKRLVLTIVTSAPYTDDSARDVANLAAAAVNALS